MLSLRCRLLQYAVFVGINGWYGNNIFFRYFPFHFPNKSILSLPFYFLRLQCIIKQLSDSVFVIFKIINVSVRVICSPSARLITLTSTLIILHITKTSSNNCLLSVLHLHARSFVETPRKVCKLIIYMMFYLIRAL